MWGHIILIVVSCSSRHGICAETPVLTLDANTLTLSVMLQENYSVGVSCLQRHYM
jgi:hypothetical protein